MVSNITIVRGSAKVGKTTFICNEVLKVKGDVVVMCEDLHLSQMLEVNKKARHFNKVSDLCNYITTGVYSNLTVVIDPIGLLRSSSIKTLVTLLDEYSDSVRFIISVHYMDGVYDKKFNLVKDYIEKSKKDIFLYTIEVEDWGSGKTNMVYLNGIPVQDLTAKVTKGYRNLCK